MTLDTRESHNLSTCMSCCCLGPRASPGKALVVQDASHETDSQFHHTFKGRGGGV